MTALDLTSRAQRHNATLDQLRQKSALAELGELALHSMDLTHILTEACRLVGEVMGTGSAKVVELHDDGSMVLRAGVEWRDGLIGSAPLDIAERVEAALLTRESMAFDDSNAGKQFSYFPFLIKNGMQAVASVAIPGLDERPPFGVLQIDSHEPCEVSPEDVAFLGEYATILAAAVHRIRIHKELRDTEERLQRVIGSLTASKAARSDDLRIARRRADNEAAEREKVEEALRQKAKVEAVGRLTGGLAHDFNNLLTGIGGSLELIRDRIKQGRFEDLNRYIDAALGSANRASDLTHRLLAFSKQQTLSPASFNINDMVRTMAGGIQDTLGTAITLDLELEPALWTTWCDASQLAAALVDLVSNARDAMPDGGHLTIRTQNARFPDHSMRNLATSDEAVALSVVDTGEGMTKSVAARVFDPFFTTKPLGQGTGLGLSMIYGFVQQSNGFIDLQTTPGSGSTFSIFLPRSHARPLDVLLPAALGQQFLDRPTTVLVVEDVAAVRMVMTDVLLDLGYTVLEAADARDALTIIQSGAPIDLLLSDVGLPGDMNGRDLADAVRLVIPDVRVLFVTGYTDLSWTGPGLHDDQMEVLTKPFSVDVFVRRVEALAMLPWVARISG